MNSPVTPRPHRSATGEWTQRTLGEFVSTRARGIVPNKTPDATFELYSVPSLDTGAPEIVKGADIRSNKQVVDEGAVLLCKINPRINRAWVVGSHSEHQKIASTEWITFPPNACIEPKYLAYFLKQNALRDFLAANASGVGGSLMRVKPATLKDYPFPVAPLPHQKRIVGEIEKQFSRLDEAVANLNRGKANLKRYKAAVLKAAVEGRLVETEAELARREGRTHETGEQVVRQLLEARRRQWKQRGSYKEPIAPQVSGGRELPEGWAWATLDQLAVVVRGASPRPAGDPRYFGGSIPWITVGPLTADDHPYLRSVPEGVTEEGKERSRYVEAETLLLTNSGATLGVPKITLVGGCINDGVAALLSVDYPLKLYLLYFLGFQTERLRRINQGAAQPNLNTTIIKALLVPVPPIAEQRRIVAEVERRLSQIKELEDQAAASVRRARRLRSALLAEAFSGGVARATSVNVAIDADN